MRLLWLIAAFWLVLISRVAFAQSEIVPAPFGLKWGASPDEVKALGATLSPGDTGAFGSSYGVTGLPSVLSDLDQILLYFDFTNRLWRIGAASKTFDNDPYGTQVRRRYDELDRILAAKYGPGTHNHYQDTRLWTAPEEFLMGIKVGQSWHYTDYLGGNVAVQLGIRALDDRNSFYTLIFENQELKKDFDEQMRKKEAGVL